jgi:hypothetical protein
MGVVYKIKLHKNRPDIGKFTKSLFARGSKVWRGAMSAYITAVAEIVAQHQDTAMSYASLFPAARDLRIKGKLPPLNPKREFAVFSKGTEGHAGEYKNRRLGEIAGEKTVVYDFGRVDRPVFKFEFEIQVYQYLMHELGNFNPHIAWMSMIAGRNAMQSYLAEHGKEVIPQAPEYFSVVDEEIG